jgi:uncharacterized membrane protein YphA (DoxX/SURF4 family)
MYVQLTCQLIIALVFAVAAAGKLRSRASWHGFTASIRDLGLVPVAAARPVAALTVAAELGVVALLALPGLTRLGFLLALVLLATLIGGIVAVLRGGRQASCNCFGRSAETFSPLHIARNLLLVTVAAAGSISGPPASYQAAGVVASVLAAVLATAFVLRFVEILSLFTLDHPTPRS